MCLMRLGLWLLPFRVIKNLLSKISPVKFFTKRDEPSVTNKIIRFTRLTSQYVPKASCLTQALAALVLIRLYGQNAELKFGFSISESEKFAAHAWLEMNGRIILGKLHDHKKYITFQSAS